MTNGQNIPDKPVKNVTRIYGKRKITTSQVDDYATGCLLDFPYILISENTKS